LQNSTLEDALNSLIATNSNYQWRLNDGVINVYPKINRDIITQELLELNIDRFVIPKSINNLKIRSNLSRLPEISEFLNKRTVTPLNLSFSSFDLINRNLKEKMVFERKSFSQILNSIIKTKISHFWCITRY